MKDVEWGEFKIGDLFDIENTLSFNSDELVKGEDFDYVTRTSQNQGILQTTSFVNEENINNSGVWSLGLLQMDFFYRQNQWYAGQFVRKIIPKFEISNGAIQFFTSALNKLKPKLLSVLVRNVDKTFLNSYITLPKTKKNEIDFEFMERFVEELKMEKISKLDTYLSELGLGDFQLTDEEKRALDNFDKLEWGVYNLENLYGKSTRGRRLKSSDRVVGKLPFVTAGEAEEGVSDFIGNNVIVFNENTTTIDMFGSAKYRNYKYGGDDHIAVVHTDKLPKYASIFVTSSIHKSSYNGQFNYGRNFYAKDADVLNISLPTKNNQPDYDSMETVISAIHKLILKDVVQYVKNKKSNLKTK